MRPISIDQSVLACPLNEILGTGAHVRLLRVLANEVVGPLSTSDAAKRAGLTIAGARKALGQLVRTGFVQRVGGGRSQQFSLRHGDALVMGIEGLFRAEQDRYHDLLSAIRSCLESLSEIRVAWIERLPERLGEPLEVGITSDPRSLSWLVQEIQRRLSEVERNFELTIETHGYTRADAPRVDWRQTTLLAGLPEGEAAEQPPSPAAYRDQERRAIRLAYAVSQLLDTDPSLVRRALVHVDRLLNDRQGPAAHDLVEWRSILESYSLERLRAFLVSQSSRAARLRRSSPFFAVLTASERDRVLEILETQNDS